MAKHELDGVMDTVPNKRDSDDGMMILDLVSLCGPDDAQPGRVPSEDARRFAPTEQIEGIQSPNIRPRWRW